MARKPFPSKPSDGQRRVLVVEDSATDRDLLRYLLEERNSIVREATTLQAAINLLDRETVDCVILDLQLPDSTGENTFIELATRFPTIPLIVMTHNKDRQLAIEMIKKGAADYVVKNFVNQDELFQRVLFAIEKHRRTIRVTPDDAETVQRLERAQVNLKSAHESGQHSAIRDTTVEMNAALAELSRRMFGEMQTLSTQVAASIASQNATAKIVEAMDIEILRGGGGRPSMRSQMDLVHHRLTAVEKDLKDTEKAVKDAEEKRIAEDKSAKAAGMSNRTKIIIAILSLVGLVGSGILSYLAATHKAAVEAEEKKK